jgi:histone-lysine N-methyltransferase SETD2
MLGRNLFILICSKTLFQLTNYLLAKESSRCKRIEDLKFSDSVKKKSADYVKKYMAKFGDAYKRSPVQ